MSILSSNNVALLFLAFYMLLATTEIAALTATIINKNKSYLVSILTVILFTVCVSFVYLLFSNWWNYEAMNSLKNKQNLNALNPDYNQDWVEQSINTSMKYYVEGMS
jgi:uncharacterized membrane protein